MPFKYAAFTVMMPDCTVEESVVLLKEFGYDGVEWRVHAKPAENIQEMDFWLGNKATLDIETIKDRAADIRRLSQDIGLEIVGLGTYLSYKMVEDIERCMEAAKIMGCASIRVLPPMYDGTVNYNDIFENAVDDFTKVEDLARKYKVRANVELHSGNICPSASLAYRFVSNFDPDYVGVIYDPGNMMREGYENWQLGLDILGPYVSHVHVKNSIWVEDHIEDGVKVWKSAMAPLKDGLVYWPDVMLALNKAGYRGWLSFEDFSKGETKTKLKEDLAYLKSVEARMGI